jgi:HNH endonuclease/NUMOD4 motif
MLEHLPVIVTEEIKPTLLLDYWKPIVGYEGIYEVSCTGRVRRLVGNKNTYPGKILRATVQKGNYPRVALHNGKKSGKRRVHQIVAEAFIGPIPENHEVNHIDTDHLNPRASNLEYLTHSDNMKHALASGKLDGFMAANGKKAVLDNEKVAHIRTLAQSELKAYSIESGIHLATIRSAWIRKSWRHVS